MFKHCGELFDGNISANSNGTTFKIYIDEDLGEYLWFDETNEGRWKMSATYGQNIKEDNGTVFVNQNRTLIFSNLPYFKSSGGEYIWKLDTSGGTAASDRWYLSTGLAKNTRYYRESGVEQGDDFWQSRFLNGTFTPEGANKSGLSSRVMAFEPFTGYMKTDTSRVPTGIYQKYTNDTPESLYRYAGITRWSFNGNGYAQQADKDENGKTVYIGEDTQKEIRFDVDLNGWVAIRDEGGYWISATDPIDAFNTSTGVMASTNFSPAEGAVGVQTMDFNVYGFGYADAYRFDIASYK